MTDAEWKRFDNPGNLLYRLRRILKKDLTDRKLALFSIACCRSVWPLLADERSRAAVEATEAFVEGHAGQGELREALALARAVKRTDDATAFAANAANSTALALAGATEYAYNAYDGACDAFNATANAAAYAGYNALATDHVPWEEAVTTIHGHQCTLLRDIFGTPPRLCKGTSPFL